MPFVKMPGVTGKVYVPKALPGQHQKHPCPDCFACQQCRDDRCTVCRGACSKTASQSHHHCQRQQPENAQAFKQTVE